MTDVSAGSSTGNDVPDMNSDKMTHKEEEVEDMDIQSILSENEVLKVQNETMKAKLLEANMMANKYLAEIDKLKEQLDHLTTPPLFIATVMEVEDDMVLLRQHGNNQEVMTRMPPGMEGQIEPGMRVSINAAFSIISSISGTTPRLVSSSPASCRLIDSTSMR